MRTRKIASFVCLCSSLLLAQSPARHGIDVADLDRNADPCSDFFQFANGTWRANNPIPASMPRWSKRWAAGETTKDKLKDILEASAKQSNAPKGSIDQIIGDYYGSCIDESKVNSRGLEPLKPWIAKIDSAKDIAGLQRTMEDMHDILLVVPFSLSGTQDPHNPTQVMADIAATGITLPDRDYYLGKEDRFKDARDKYKDHVTKLLTLAGWSSTDATAATQTIFDMETKFAEASLDTVTLRDPSATDHKTTFAQLQALAPHIDWPEYFRHKQLPTTVDLNVQEPKYLAAVDRMMQETPLADWKTYYKWQLVNSMAPFLTTPMVEEDFAFNGKYLSGASEKASLEALRGIHR